MDKDFFLSLIHFIIRWMVSNKRKFDISYCNLLKQLTALYCEKWCSAKRFVVTAVGQLSATQICFNLSLVLLPKFQFVLSFKKLILSLLIWLSLKLCTNRATNNVKLRCSGIWFSGISSARDYTVLSHFECFSMRTSIVEIKLVAHDSGSEYISWKTHTLKTYRAKSQCALFIIVKIKNLFWDKILFHWKPSSKLVLRKYPLFRGLNNRFWIGWAHNSMLCKFMRIFVKINFTKYSKFFR
jgi:hypothetical protein